MPRWPLADATSNHRALNGRTLSKPSVTASPFPIKPLYSHLGNNGFLLATMRDSLQIGTCIRNRNLEDFF
ncbi:MAG: hypothetical protein ACFFFH_09365 [Candidatus Thorarchaeota archaeon]